MKKRLLVLAILCFVSIGCVPMMGGHYVTNAGILESDEGIHSVELPGRNYS